jgi:hypothetical protein
MGNQSTYKRFFGRGIFIELSKDVHSAVPRYRNNLKSKYLKSIPIAYTIVLYRLSFGEASRGTKTKG